MDASIGGASPGLLRALFTGSRFVRRGESSRRLGTAVAGRSYPADRSPGEEECGYLTRNVEDFDVAFVTNLLDFALGL